MPELQEEDESERPTPGGASNPAGTYPHTLRLNINIDQVSSNLTDFGVAPSSCCGSPLE